jgi:hypothetical protein
MKNFNTVADFLAWAVAEQKKGNTSEVGVFIAGRPYIADLLFSGVSPVGHTTSIKAELNQAVDAMAAAERAKYEDDYLM